MQRSREGHDARDVQTKTKHRGRPTPAASSESLWEQPERWTADGLITGEQAATILMAKQHRRADQATAARGISVTAELLAYLGGAQASIGAILLGVWSWPDLASWTRLLLVGTVPGVLSVRST